MTPAEVISVGLLHGHWLRLSFKDGAVIDIDAEPLIKGGGVFAPIESDRAVFEAVHVDNGTITWPGEIDVCPDVLYGHGEPVDGTRFERRVVRPASGVA